MKRRLFPGIPLCVYSVSPSISLCLLSVIQDSAPLFIKPLCLSWARWQPHSPLQGCRSDAFVCPHHLAHLFLDTGLCHSLPDRTKYHTEFKKKKKKSTQGHEWCRITQLIATPAQRQVSATPGAGTSQGSPGELFAAWHSRPCWKFPPPSFGTVPPAQLQKNAPNPFTSPAG